MKRMELEFKKSLEKKGLRLINLDDLHLDEQFRMSEEISAITKTEETLLFQSPEDILGKLVVVVIVNRSGDVVSTCSIMEPGINRFGHTVAEMGGMWTRKDYRHLKLATHLAQLVEIIATEKGIDLLYAFACKYSVKILARLGYVGEVSIDNLGWSECPIIPDPEDMVNAADLIDPIAIDFCRNVCQNPTALDAMWRLDFIKSPDFSKCSNSLLRQAVLGEFHKDIARREEKFAKEIDKLISEGGDEQEVKVVNLAIDIYLTNLNNDLCCCDLVAVKILRK